MESIFNLFGTVIGYIAGVSLLLPILTSILARKNKTVFSIEMRLLEIVAYITFLVQITSHSTWYNFNLDKNIIFYIYLPVHTVVFSYMLLKWTDIIQNNLFIIYGIIIILISAAIIFVSPIFSSELLFWFNAIILLTLSFYLSFKRDKRNLITKRELNFIHHGIYIGSLLTVLGIALSRLDIIFFSYFIHVTANITTNLYFARSFRCLYH